MNQLSPIGTNILSQLIESYDKLYDAYKRTLEENLKETLRGVDYYYGAKGILGSGPWMKAREKVLQSGLEEASKYGTNLVSQLLSQARTTSLYEQSLIPSVVQTLQNLYGTQGILSQIPTAYQLASIPQSIAQENINVALQDLLYRLGILGRIAGGFGQPFVRTQYTTSSLPAWYSLIPLLSGVGYGLLMRA